MKKFDNDLWPVWEDRGRVEYPDLIPLPKSYYDQAREVFTEENIEAIRKAFKIPHGFNLTERLRRAVYHYFWFKAGRQSDLGFSELLPASQQREQVKDICKKTSDLLSILQKRELDHIALLSEYQDRDGINAAQAFLDDLKAKLKYLKHKAEERANSIQTKKGDHTDIARRVFCGHLLKIYEEVHLRPAKSTIDGPAHKFFELCFSIFINQNVDRQTIFLYLKESIREREKIKSGPLFN
jgi:hypothetical protein